MKFYTVCTLPHYFPDDVYKLKRQLVVYYGGTVDLYVYTDRPHLFDDSVNTIPISHNLCQRQWYKVDFLGDNITTGDDPIIILDLDCTIFDDVTDVIDTPIERNEFRTVERWWRNKDTDILTVNGGMYKFYPGTCKRAYNTFYSNPRFWQTTYFGPNRIEGEQNFVADVIALTHNITHFPGKKIGRWSSDRIRNETYMECYERDFSEPLITDGKFNSQIALLHARLSYS